jgi:organic radical activating enzyme
MKGIYAIEITSKCNLACDWCVHYKMKREKKHMSMIDYERSISICLKLEQKSIILNNIGEPLLHPHIHSMIKLASTNEIETIFHTNCTLLNEIYAVGLKEAGLTKIVLSNQMKEYTDWASENCEKAGLNYEINSIKDLNWGGQHHHDREKQIDSNTEGCELFIKNEQVIIFSDGSIGTCCIDYENIGKLGSIWDDNWFELKPKPLSICKECHNI